MRTLNLIFGKLAMFSILATSPIIFTSNSSATTLDTVTIWGAYEPSFNLFASVQFNTAFYPFTSRVQRVSLDELMDQYLSALTSPLTTNDIRCNVLATADTKATTSQSDAEGRFAAANQLFTAISAQQGGIGAKAAISGNHYFYNNRITPTFQVIYADGGKEQWIVATLVPMTLVINGDVPGSLVQGDGTVHGCPT